jgi:hypothetical protein
LPARPRRTHAGVGRPWAGHGATPARSLAFVAAGAGRRRCAGPLHGAARVRAATTAAAGRGIAAAAAVGIGIGIGIALVEHLASCGVQVGWARGGRESARAGEACASTGFRAGADSPVIGGTELANAPGRRRASRREAARRGAGWTSRPARQAARQAERGSDASSVGRLARELRQGTGREGRAPTRARQMGLVHFLVGVGVVEVGHVPQPIANAE